MQKQMKSSVLMVTIVMAVIAIQICVQATPGPLLFTEDGSTLTATIDGVPFGTITLEQDYWLLKMDPAVTIPLPNPGDWYKSWEYIQPDGTKIETLIHITYANTGYYPYLPTYYYAEISTGPEGPYSYVNAPYIPDGTIAPWGPFEPGEGQPANQWFSGVEFINLADTAAVPDTTSTLIFLIIGGLALYGSQRLAFTQTS